jgi:GntR family transcriptional regulator
VFRINPQSGVPMYLQLIEQVRYSIEVGALEPGDQLPGIRKLAEELVMNPNTVAKAYREMQHAGLIVLRHGAGAFVAEPQDGERSGNQTAMRKGRTIVHRAVGSLRSLGLNDGAIRRLVESELTETDPAAGKAPGGDV